MGIHWRILTPMVLFCQHGACPEWVAAVLICVDVVVPVVPCPVATVGHSSCRMASLGNCMGAGMRRLHLVRPNEVELARPRDVSRATVVVVGVEHHALQRA